jgi:hypothetical protein
MPSNAGALESRTENNGGGASNTLSEPGYLPTADRCGQLGISFAFLPQLQFASLVHLRKNPATLPLSVLFIVEASIVSAIQS